MRNIFLGLCAVLLVQTQLFGFSAVLHFQGEEGDRENYFARADDVSNRTPPTLEVGGVEIKEMQVTAVYENANKPEWVTMNLQFECPAALTADFKENPIKQKAGDTVKFRMGSGSYKIRRSDLKSESLPTSDWKTSNAPILTKAAAIACNDLEIRKIARSSASKTSFNYDKFGKEINDKFTLPTDMMLTEMSLPTDFLDFSWTILWWEKNLEGKRPNPSGKWTQKATKSQKEAAIKTVQNLYKELSPQLDATQKRLEDGMAQNKAKFEFQDKAAKLRKGRKQNKFEVSLNNFWVGKAEQEVVDTMGKPELNNAGDTRFLTYIETFDNRGYAIHAGSGAMVSSGIYAECYAEFATMQDDKGVWRVADVKVRADGSHLGMAKSLCSDLQKTPN